MSMSFLRPSQLHSSSKRHRLDSKGMGNQLIARSQQINPASASTYGKGSQAPTTGPVAVGHQPPTAVPPQEAASPLPVPAPVLTPVLTPAPTPPSVAYGKGSRPEEFSSRGMFIKPSGSGKGSR